MSLCSFFEYDVIGPKKIWHQNDPIQGVSHFHTIYYEAY